MKGGVRVLETLGTIQDRELQRLCEEVEEFLEEWENAIKEQ